MTAFLNGRGPARLAWCAVGVIYVLVLATVALTVASWSVIGNTQLTATLLQQLTPAITVGLVGGILAARPASRRVGWVLLFPAFLGVVQAFTQEYVVRGQLVAPGSLPAVQWVAWVASWEPGLVYPGAVVLILLFFPTGRLISARWRPVLWLDLLGMVLLSLVAVLDPGLLQVEPGLVSVPNPTGVAALSGLANGPVGTVIRLGAELVALAAVASLVVRLRRAQGDEREQVRWVAYVIGVTTALAVIIHLVSLGVPALQSPWYAAGGTIAGFGIGLPAAMTVAILKYRLYDIDVVISRTLVYGSLALLITGVYVGIAVGIGELIGSGGKPNLGLSILATAIVAVCFEPVRERVQRIANRLVYGKRATPYEVLAQFSQRVAESYAAEDVMPRMARVLAEGTGAQRADVWLRSGDLWRDAAVWPPDAPARQPASATNGTAPALEGGDRVIEVRHQGDLLGALSVTKRSSESLTPVEENLLAHLAGQAGLVLRNVGLTSDLHARLAELRSSRQRLVTAQDEERRRLERNLHDGAQQHLVALKVKLGLAEMLLARDQEKAKSTLAQLKGDADEALETLRDLARGIYPPLLADKGLAAALESQARKATLPVKVDAGGIGRYPQDVEAAVYFSVLEALQNVQKYAQATRATVCLREADGWLRFSVSDDGQGFDVATTVRGTGLTNMADRLDALGGRLDVHSTVGSGTDVSGSLLLYETTPAADQASTRRSGLNSALEMNPAAPASSA